MGSGSDTLAGGTVVAWADFGRPGTAHQLLAGRKAERGEDVAGHALAGGHAAGTERRTGAAHHRDCALSLLRVSNPILCFFRSMLVRWATSGGRWDVCLVFYDSACTPDCVTSTARGLP